MNSDKMSVIDVFELLETTSGSSAKFGILTEHVENDLLRRSFLAGLDPDVVYNVTKFKQPQESDHTIDDDDAVEMFLELLTRLSSRQATGNAAKGLLTKFFEPLDWRQQKWCKRILLKKLRCGVQCSLMNKVWPDAIKKFTVQLATSFPNTYDKDTHSITLLKRPEYPLRVEPKLDGLRCIAVKHEGNVTLYTRNGTVIDTLPRIKSLLTAMDHYDEVVLDGECMASDWNSTTSIVMSDVSLKDDLDVVYNVFDAVKYDEWVSRLTDERYVDRIARVASITSKLPLDAPVRQVPGEIVENDEELMKCYRDAMEKKFEGIMLKDVNAPYEFKRGRAIQKLKPITTFEGVIVDHFNGREGTNREFQFAGFLVLLYHAASGRGVVTRCGGGFSDKLRAEIQLTGPETYIGKVIEIEGQPDITTTDSLSVDGRVRFPVFIRFRHESDVDPIVMNTYESYRQNVSSRGDCRR